MCLGSRIDRYLAGTGQATLLRWWRTLPFTTADAGEQQFRQQYFWQSLRLEAQRWWYHPRLNRFFPRTKHVRRTARWYFAQLHHPQSSVRWLAHAYVPTPSR